MIEPIGGDRRPPITPQLALRVAILGGVALVLFAILFFRLWFLQVLSGDQYLAEARNNRVRELRVQAPRGDIVDRQGRTMVESRSARVIQIEPDTLPPVVHELANRYRVKLSAAERRRRARGAKRIEDVPAPPLPASERKVNALYKRLGRVLTMRPQTIHEEVLRQIALTPYSNVTVKTDVPFTVRAYIEERKDRFPGVSVERIYVRKYPEKELAAQIFGAVGEISPRELKTDRYTGVKPGTIVGRGGIEEQYDRYLRGDDGATRVQVNANGDIKGRLGKREPVQGRQLRLSLDLDLQKAGQQALNVSRHLGGGAPAAAFVAMDPRNGEILGLGSSPSFDPNDLVKPISQEEYEAKFRSEAAGAPLFNRAVQGLYPTGSVFKVVTAAAALQSQLITPDTPIHDPGFFKIGAQTFTNAGEVPNGTISMRRAIEVSSDVFFYTLGARLNGMEGQVLQKWARNMGLGRRTGIDLPDEFRGTIPDKRWRARLARKELNCRKRTDKPSCGYSDARPWSVGDNVNLSVGQGDLQATPLQMAVAYATIANGGRVVRPHLGLRVENSAGQAIQRIEPGAARKIDLSESTLSAIRDGLRLAASGPRGTSSDVFRDWPHERYPVYGKTGTAERQPFPDQSWYVAYVPDPARPLVVALTVERGGWGAKAAAPAVRLILSQYYGVEKKVIAGESRTN